MKNYLTSIKKTSLCILCRLECKNNLPICAQCEVSFSLIPQQKCNICLAKITNDTTKCTNCIISKPFFDSMISVYQYDPFTKFLLNQMKFNQHSGIAIFFAHKLSHSLKDFKFDIIIPTPIHHLRWISRGYNPVLLIASMVSKNLNIPLVQHSLIKNKYTKPLSISNKRDPRIITKSFFLKKSMPYNILLIDDIITTGTTANSIAKILKQNKAKSVTIAAAIKVY